MKDKITLHGKLELKRTCGLFNKLIAENKEVFKTYFGIYLFPGSVNVKVEEPKNLQQDMDRGVIRPKFSIPRNQLVGMPDYIGDGQTWVSRFLCDKFEEPMDCWVFRRVGSRVPKGIIEVVAGRQLVVPFGLEDGDSVIIEMLIEA